MAKRRHTSFSTGPATDDWPVRLSGSVRIFSTILLMLMVVVGVVALIRLHYAHNRDEAHKELAAVARMQARQLEAWIGCRDTQAGAKALDPDGFPEHLSSPWPWRSESGETLVMRLRDARGETSMTGELARAALAVGEGFFRCRDGRGEPVVAYAVAVTGAPWTVVAKIDEAESLAPVRTMALRAVIVAALLIFFLVLILWLYGVQARAREARRRLEAARERLAVTQHFEWLSRYANDIILLLDENGVIVEANERASCIYGYPRNLLVGKGADDLAADGDTAWSDWKTQLSDGHAHIYKLTHVRADGSPFPVEASVRRFEAEGRVFVQAILRDISDRKRAEEWLYRLSRAYRLLSECNQDIIRADREAGMLERVCRRAVDSGGYRMAWIGERVEPGEGRPLTARAWAGHEAGYMAWLRQVGAGAGVAGPWDAAARSGEDQVVPRMEDLAGDALWADEAIKRGYASCQVLALKDVDGETFGVFTLFGAAPLDAEDQAERQLLRELADDLSFGLCARREHMALQSAQEGLLRQERLYRLLADNSTDVIALHDAAGLLRYVSPASQAVLGYAPSDLLGRDLFILVHPDDLERVRSLQRRLLEGEPLNCVAFRVVKADGSHRWVETTATPVRSDAGGAVQEIVSVTRDIEERMGIKHTLDEARMQLMQAQKMEAIGQLAGGVAHDFNNALMVIVNQARFVRETLPADSEGHRDLGELLRAAERATTLTRQLLAFARKHPVTETLIDLNELVAQWAASMQRMLGEDIELRVISAGAPRRIEADRQLTEQALMNLAVNARDAMPRGGQLTIRVHEKRYRPEEVSRVEAALCEADSCVALSVEDTGEGISAEALPHVFEPFFTTKEVGQGSGLGLSTVYGIMRQHHGCVQVASKAGEGTVFTLFWPEAGARANGAPAESEREQASEKPLRGKGLLALLVEDDAFVRRLTQRLLTRMGFRVVAAASGREALEAVQAEQGPIDLLVSDVIMPGMSGIELSRHFKQQYPEAKVLLISGYPSRHLTRHGLEEERSILLSKPFTRHDLEQALSRLLGTGSSVRQPSSSASGSARAG